MRKYVLILATDTASGDSVTMVLTSKPNGLTENPACCVGLPRSGYFLGVPGDILAKPTWVDFSSIEILDDYDLNLHIQAKRKTLLKQFIDTAQLCSILRCALQCEDDISNRQYRWLSNTAATLHCR